MGRSHGRGINIKDHNLFSIDSLSSTSSSSSPWSSYVFPQFNYSLSTFIFLLFGHDERRIPDGGSRNRRGWCALWIKYISQIHCLSFQTDRFHFIHLNSLTAAHTDSPGHELRSSINQRSFAYSFELFFLNRNRPPALFFVSLFTPSRAEFKPRFNFYRQVISLCTLLVISYLIVGRSHATQNTKTYDGWNRISN